MLDDRPMTNICNPHRYFCRKYHMYMNQELKILTFTHKHCNIRDISKYVIQSDVESAKVDILNRLKAEFHIDEIMYLSTCNRVMYLIYQHKLSPTPDMRRWIHYINPTIAEQDLNEADIKSEVYTGQEAIEHVFELSSSLDSLVVGEREIFRQLRDAYDWSREQQLCGDNTRLLMRFAIQAAKDVFTNTGIGERALSVVALAIQKMMALKPKKNARILLVGAGQTNHLVSKFLLKYQFDNVEVFNRSIEKANAIAEKFGRKGQSLSDLLHFTGGFDIIFVCTASHEHIINEPLLKLLRNGDTSDKLVIDLAIPSNVAPEVKDRSDITYIDIDQLRHLASENLEFRRAEVSKARILLAGHIDTYQSALQQRKIEKAMQSVPQAIKSIREKAISEVFAKDLDNMDAATRAKVEEMMAYMEKKCISIPIKAAKAMVL